MRTERTRYRLLVSQFPQEIRRPLLVVWRLALVSGAVAAFGLTPAGAPPLPVLTSIRQVRVLSRDQANQGYPVRIRGVVTFFHVATAPVPVGQGALDTNMFVQDSTGGNWVKVEPGQQPALNSGDRIELEGVTVQTDFAPDIVQPHWRILGRAQLPIPKHAEFGRLVSTEEDSRWVEVDGIVRAAVLSQGNLRVDLAMDGGRVTAYVPDLQDPIPPGLIDAKVRARGVCGALFNEKNQVRGINLFVPNIRQIQILQAGVTDPFSTPAQTLESVLRFAVGGSSGHRVHVQGIVTLQRPGRFAFLKDASGNIRVDSDQRIRFVPGQHVDVVGFPAVGEYGPTLQQAQFRAAGGFTRLTPEIISAKALLREQKNGELVQLEATLLDRTLTQREQILIASGDGPVVQAELRDPTSLEVLSRLEPGSRLRLTGVSAMREDGATTADSLQLLLRSTKDIAVLSQPSWWTLRRGLWLLLGMLGLIVAIIAWVAVLRRRLAVQTRVIQKRLETENSLEQRYRRLFERNLAGVYRVNHAGTLIDANDACARILGYENRSQLLASGGHALPLRDAILNRLSETHRTASSEVSLHLKDGRQIWVLVNAHLLDDEAEPIIEGTIIEITELKQTVRTLEERTTYLHALITNNPLGVVVMNSQRKVISCNRAFEELFLFRKNKILGHDIDDLVLQPSKSAEFASQLTLLEAGQTTFTVTSTRRKDSTSIDLEVRGVPIIIDGHIAGFYAIYEDITARVAAEGELRATKEAAEAANRAKSEFLANMSHEIRTPLNGVLLAAELAAAEALSPSQKEYLSTIRASGESLLLLLNDLLDLSKIEAGKMELNAAPFAVEACLRECITLFEGPAQQKGLELALDVSDGFPEVVSGDALRLRQVVLNLVGNAVKFTQTGSVTIRAKYLGRQAGRLLCQFSVADTGIGIPADKHLSVFQEFEQGDSSTTRRFGGTGLGLAISRRLVQLMGGDIWLESTENRGSTFYFTAGFSAAAAGERPLQQITAVANDPPTPALRILLAEDNAINKRLAVRLLERDGHTVVAVDNGLDAVRACLSGSFDAVLMDVHMPEMDGIEAVRQIRYRERASGAHTTVIAMTASAMKEDREACLAAGMDAFVSKPISTAELLAALRSAARAQPVPASNI